jgi:hypothetical protein
VPSAPGALIATVETAWVPEPEAPGVLRASTHDPTDTSASDAETLRVSEVAEEICTFDVALADCTEIVVPSTPVIAPLTPGGRPCPCACCCAEPAEALPVAEQAVSDRAPRMTTAAVTASRVA